MSVQLIGYYNHNQFPVQFPLPNGRGSIELQPGEPILGERRLLVEYPNNILEEEVRLGTIKHIRSNHELAGWNAKQMQANTIVMQDKGPDGFPAKATRLPAKASKVPTTEVSAGAPPRESDIVPPVQTPASNVMPSDLAESGAAGDSDPQSESEQPEQDDTITIDEFVARGKADGTLTQKGNGVIVYQGQEFRGKAALLTFLQRLAAGSAA